MAITTKEGILKVLRSFNPWWVNGAVNPAFLRDYKRFAYYEAISRLENTNIRRTVVLTGTRRVGKTTIEYQLIHTLLQNGVPPPENCICFFGSSYVETGGAERSFRVLS